MSAFKSMGDPNIQAAVAGDVNRYMENAVSALEAKYAAGKGGLDASETGPTGNAYQAEAAKVTAQKKRAKELRQQLEDENSQRTSNAQLNSDDEGDGDEDADLRMLREKRLREIKVAELEKIENMGKGHGQYRETVQDEFLGQLNSPRIIVCIHIIEIAILLLLTAEVTSSKTVCCHFYHDEFPRCKIMDHHLLRLATRHVETKFIKVRIYLRV